MDKNLAFRLFQQLLFLNSIVSLSNYIFEAYFLPKSLIQRNGLHFLRHMLYRLYLLCLPVPNDLLSQLVHFRTNLSERANSDSHRLQLGGEGIFVEVKVLLGNFEGHVNIFYIFAGPLTRASQQVLHVLLLLFHKHLDLFCRLMVLVVWAKIFTLQNHLHVFFNQVAALLVPQLRVNRVRRCLLYSRFVNNFGA